MSIEYFDKVYCICMEDRPKKREKLFQQIHNHFPGCNPVLFNAISTRHLKNHHIGCALSHRAVIQEAKDKGYKKILVFEEDAVLHKDFSMLLEENIKEVVNVDWDILYLGACIWERKHPKPPREFEVVKNCNNLKVLTGATCTQGLAYNSTCFDYILDSLPDNIDDMQTWCKRHSAIDQWFMYFMQGRASVREGFRKFKCYITEPRICSQPFLIGTGKQDKPDGFLL
jgi:GR25 family glycosyltransferase involved in LPS biosynthesis